GFLWTQYKSLNELRRENICCTLADHVRSYILLIPFLPNIYRRRPPARRMPYPILRRPYPIFPATDAIWPAYGTPALPNALPTVEINLVFRRKFPARFTQSINPLPRCRR